MPRQAIYFCNQPANVKRVYAGGVAEKLEHAFKLPHAVYGESDLKSGDFSKAEALFSTWGMPHLTREEIKRYFPAVKAVFYAAGSVQEFAREWLDEEVRVFSAWQANAVPVVEYTVSQILLANKGFFQLARRTQADYRDAEAFFTHYRGNYGAKVGILGDGAIGSRVIRKLKEYRLDIYVFSVTMTAEQARELGVKKASLKEIFCECDVISNHLANNKETVGMINRTLINSMKPYATFLNTGRGAQVDEGALAEKLRSDPTITAVLDVTCPEPPAADSPLLRLNNVILTPHIAGSAGGEVVRMAEYMAEESERFFSGKECLFEVTKEMLERMA